MDKNSIIGFLLIIAVIFGFSYFNRPDEEQLKQQREEQTANSKQQQNSADASVANATTVVAQDSIFATGEEQPRLVVLKTMTSP